MTNLKDSANQSFPHAYDKLSRPQTLTALTHATATATVATYRYDAIDRLTKILDAASAPFNFTYDPTNKLTSQKAPNGLTASYQYDGLDRLTRLTNKKGQATIADFQYQFNDASNISQITDLASTNNYSYDAVDRLAALVLINKE